RELLDTRINSPRKLLACAERLPIGQVPLLKGLSKNVSASTRYLVDDSDHEFAAAIRSAQWNFNLQHKNVLSGSVLVTSALPGEGKTTIAAALARSLSLANKSVLLIDANFSHPGAHRELGISLKSTGLSNLFTGKQQFYKLLRKDPITKVHLLSTGPKPQDPAALFAQDNLGRFLSFAEDKYDHVIVDGAALSAGPEALLLSRHVKSTLLVVDSATTTRDHVADSVKSLESNTSTPFGVVLNRVKNSSQQILFAQTAPSGSAEIPAQDSVISVSFPKEPEEVLESTSETATVPGRAGTLGSKSRQILEALIRIAEKEDRQVNINESNSAQR
ncbi:MAG: tyrosine-protein kinase family protein, partial [Pseudomonadales bacterium]